jgi:hypothetical protein
MWLENAKLNSRNQLFVNLLNKIADKFPSDYVKQMKMISGLQEQIAPKR